MRSVIAMICAGALACLAGSLTATQQKQAAALEGKLLAPCCYQEPVVRHQSEAAVRMRLEIERLVAEGKTETEIVDLYVQRYGTKVLAGYAPTPGWSQYLPWGLTLFATVILSWWVWRKVQARNTAAGHL